MTGTQSDRGPTAAGQARQHILLYPKCVLLQSGKAYVSLILLVLAMTTVKIFLLKGEKY